MLQPYFLETAKGRLFVQSYVPDTPNGQVVIFVPPFAEEMNKSRRMMALLGHSLASKGVQMDVLDLFGTGDSEGEFEDADWSIWLDNLQQLITQLKEQNIQRIHLIGLRMGCLLIQDFLQLHPLDIEKVIFWKPVLSGKQMINQFLRLRIASSMMDGDKETAQSLRAVLFKEGVVEVAGYGLSKALVLALDEKAMSTDEFDSAVEWHWFEVLASENQPLPLAATKVLQSLMDRNITVCQQTIIGENFWANQEIAELPELISATSQVFV
ncbi:MAG: hydrolase 2, exosortase A system-associated [Piscirickettsiaceae bacterium]|nr:MAG: hydrolase 2, exosortase A system-associated [Piscirickettsiaceae bacterium]